MDMRIAARYERLAIPDFSLCGCNGDQPGIVSRDRRVRNDLDNA